MARARRGKENYAEQKHHKQMAQTLLLACQQRRKWCGAKNRIIKHPMDF